MTLAMWRLTFTLCAERAAAALVTAALALVPAIAAEQAPVPPASAAPKVGPMGDAGEELCCDTVF